MGSVDLRDTYYSVDTASDSGKFFKICVHNKLHEFTCMPNDLTLSSRIIIKLLKPIFSFF